MTSSAIAILTPVLIAMALLSWDTTSSIWMTFERGGKDKSVASNGLRPAQQCLSHSKRRREGSESSDVCEALIASGIFSRTNPEAVSALSKQLEPVHFGPGYVMGAQSDFGCRLYVIISGKVKVSYRLPDGCDIMLTVLGSSEILGAITLFDPGAREISVTTLTEVLAVPIEHDQLQVWMAERPEVRDQVMRLFARRANAMTNLLVDFAFVDAQKRIASRLLFLSKRFGRREGDVVRVVHDLTLKDFSRLVGVAPKTIVETLRDFEDRGWIRLEDNSVAIADGQALASLSPMSMSEACCA